MSIMLKKSEYDNSIFKSCEKFLKPFNAKKILKESNAAKDKGVSAYSIIAFLLSLVFTGKNFYTLLEKNPEKIYFGEDTVYRLMNKTTVNWEKFLFKLSCNVVQSVDRLTFDARKTALVIDDSPYYRNRSKKAAFLSRCYDHVEHKYYKGLTLEY